MKSLSGWTRRSAWLLLCVFITPALAALSPIEQRFAAFDEYRSSSYKVSMKDLYRAQQIANKYNELFSPYQNEGVREINLNDLRLLYRAASLVLAYTQSPRYVLDARLDLSEIEKRNAASNMDYLQMYNSLIGARMLDEARSLAARRHITGIEPIPVIKQKDGGVAPQGEWEVSPESQEVLLRHVKLSGKQIIVIGHPLCHFTQNAATSINNDPDLGPIFIRYSHWIIPQSEKFELPAIQEWNRTHSQEPMSIAYRSSDWPMFDSWATPTFYFLNDGKVVSEVIGWPAEGNRDQILKSLRKIELLK